VIRTSEVKTVLQRVQTSNSVLLVTPNTEFECMCLKIQPLNLAYRVCATLVLVERPRVLNEL
jgi:hypothetical protein